MQNLNIQYATTKKPVLAITQEPATTEKQQSISEKATDTWGPVTMASLLQENEFLKLELEGCKKELVMAREAFDKELNLYTLAHTASMQEKHTENDPYK